MTLNDRLTQLRQFKLESTHSVQTYANDVNIEMPHLAILGKFINKSLILDQLGDIAKLQCRCIIDCCPNAS